MMAGSAGWWTAVFEPVWTASLLPSNTTTWQRVVEAVDADMVARDPVGLIAAARSDAEAPLQLLPYLAAERSVDEYTSDWSEARQRAVTAVSFGLHRVKGTRSALDAALRPLGYDVQVVEWFEPDPARPSDTFRIRVEIGTDEPWTNADYETLVRVANGAKNAHTLMERVEPVRRVGPGAVFVGGYARTTRTIRIQQDPPPPPEIRTSTIVFVGGALISRRTVRIPMRT